MEIYLIETSTLHSDISSNIYQHSIPIHDRIQVIQHQSDYQSIINYIRFIPDFILVFVMALIDRYCHKLGLLLDGNRESEWVDVSRVVVLVVSLLLIIILGRWHNNNNIQYYIYSI